MRRDLELGVDPAALVLSPPDRSELRELFRRFEFRGLLNRIDDLDVAVPAAEPVRVAGTEVAWREDTLPEARGRIGLAIADGRFALADDSGVVVGPWERALAGRLSNAEVVAHDAKALRLPFSPIDDTMIAAYLIEPGRASYELGDLAAEYGVEAVPVPAAEEETDALVRHAETPRRLAGPMRERLAERGSTELYEGIELPLVAVLAAMEDAGVKIDTYRMGEITARLAENVEELESRALRARGRGVHARLDPAGRADPVREARS